MRKSLAIAILAVMGAAAIVRGAAPAKEELRGCPLPHGEAMIPVAGTFEATNGEFLKLSDGSMVSATSTWQGKKAEAVQDMRAKHVADLAFLPEGGGTLWAVSGRIVDVGAKYLYEAAAMTLDRPEEIPGNARQPSGMIKGVQEGRTFLVETTDEHYALVRLLEISKVGAVVEYVYQPSGGIHFDVQSGAMVDVIPWSPLREPAKRKDGAAGLAGAAAQGAQVTQPAVRTVSSEGIMMKSSMMPVMPAVLEPPFSTFMRQRELVIESRMKLLTSPAKGPAEVDRKVNAINELAQMHADVAAGEMARQVAFLNPRGAGKEFQESVHPCFAGLKKLGKAGSDAAVKELREMSLEGDTEGLDSPSYRAGLLALVIRSVEGDDVGQFILRRERELARDEKRRKMYEQLISPAVEGPGN